MPGSSVDVHKTSQASQNCKGSTVDVHKTSQASYNCKGATLLLMVGLCLSRLFDKGCCQGQELVQRACARCHDAGQQADDSYPQPQCARGHVNDE